MKPIKYLMTVDNMMPTFGGIQNTAYILFRDGFSKEEGSRAFSSELDEEYRQPYIDQVKKFTRINSVCWTFNHSDENTWNIAMNCWMGLPAFVAKKTKRSKYFVLAHGNDIYGLDKPGSWIKDKIFHAINKMILQNADFVACNSNYTKELLQKAVSPRRTVVIHPPCEVVDDGSNDTTVTNNVIFCMGRLVERKGFQFVIKAMPSIIGSIPDAKAYIAGNGPYKEVLQGIIDDLGLQDKVFLLGRISEQKKQELLASCAVFAMPSIEIENDNTVEGFGIVFLEANQYGKYVIGGNSGGMPESILDGVTGTTLPDISDKTVSTEIVNILQNKEKYYSSDMVEKRKQWAGEHSAQCIYQIYAGIAKSCNTKAADE